MGNMKSKLQNMRLCKSNKTSKSKKRRYLTLSDEDIDVLVRETHFNNGEIVHWHTDFLRDCPDGLLSEQHFVTMYQQICNTPNAMAVAKSLFRAFDCDGTGTIDFGEFIRAISITTRGDYEEKLNMIFRLYDINNDGKLERNEMSHIIETLFGGNVPQSRIDQVFSLLDLNKDSVITKSEFIEACSNNDEVRRLLDPNNSIPANNDLQEEAF